MSQRLVEEYLGLIAHDRPQEVRAGVAVSP
jgi:hypothetical protein